MQPTAFILRLPIGDTALITSHAIDNASGYQVGPSPNSINVYPDLAHRGFSVVPFASLLGLGNRFPHLRSLRLRCIILKPDYLEGALVLDAVPRFALLESLTILPGSARISGEASITMSLLLLFPHMPRLQNLTVYASLLTVYASLAFPHYEPESGLPYPDPPFSLKRFSCVGVLSISACAHIISNSIRTLEELTLNVGMAGVDEEASLIAALAQAAPRLRILELRLRGNEDRWLPIKPVFSALVRVETLRLEMPLALHDALALLGGSCTSLRELDIRCARYSHAQPSALAPRFSAFLSPMSLLRSVTLRDFDGRDGEVAALLAHCRARRISCSITHF